MKNDDKIVSLKGPERVRRRPAVVFGIRGGSMSFNALWMLLEVFISQASLGFCKKISVQIEKDHTVVIESLDRGLLLDETLRNGRPAWYDVFCDFGCPPREPDGVYFYEQSLKHNALYGEEKGDDSECLADWDPAFNLCAVQCACGWMTVESVHGSVLKRLSFKKGYPAADLERESVSAPSYTKISFQLDSEVFDDISVSFDDLSQVLRCAAVAVPGLHCTLNSCDKTAEFFYQAGCTDYVKELVAKLGDFPVFSCEIFANGKDRYNKDSYDARVRAAVSFVPEGGGRVECIHNRRALSDGGKHLEAAKKKILRFLCWHYDIDATFAELADRVILVLDTSCQERMTRWANRQGTALGNRMIRDMTADVFGGDFDRFLKTSEDKILPLFNG